MSTEKDLLKFDIKQWCDQEKVLIDEFAKDWVTNHQFDSKKWPLELTAAEWDEQFWVWHHDPNECTPEEHEEMKNNVKKKK